MSTALIAALVGLLVLAIVMVSAGSWYATSLSPLVLVVTPGAALAALTSGSQSYWLVALVLGQASSYALAALLIREVVTRARSRRPDAV